MIKSSKTVLKCTNCDPSYKLREMNPRSIIRGKRAEYCKGFIGTHIGLDAPVDYNEKLDKLICPFCNNALIDTGLLVEDFHLIGKATDWNRQILDLMMELHEKDLIEYQLKLNQFKLQQEQHEAIKDQERESSKLHCPTCNSTKVKKISGTAKVAGAAMFGLFSKTAKSQFKCENCGYKW